LVASESSPATVDWRPYQATAAVLSVAIALNLLTGNRLWLAYSVLGAAVFAFGAGFVRAGRWRPPTRAVWLVGLTWGLHYVGGSMAGLHQVGGPNGLYYALPWWDNVVHALGSAAVAVAATAGLLPRLPGHRTLAALCGVAVACLVGTLVELYEFAQYLWFGTVDQGFYTNTMVDLYDNVVGGAVGASLYALASVPRADTAAPAPTGPPDPPSPL
jgi:hypothetical protein